MDLVIEDMQLQNCSFVGKYFAKLPTINFSQPPRYNEHIINEKYGTSRWQMSLDSGLWTEVLGFSAR